MFLSVGYRNVYENILIFLHSAAWFCFNMLAILGRDDIFMHHKVWKYNLCITKNFKACYQKANLSMAERKYGLRCGLWELSHL